MAIFSGSIPVGAQVPAAGIPVGGGLIVAIYIGAGGDSTDYILEHSPDGGTTWGVIATEGGVARKCIYGAHELYQIDPPVRAPLFRINGDTNEATAALSFKVHTV